MVWHPVDVLVMVLAWSCTSIILHMDSTSDLDSNTDAEVKCWTDSSYTASMTEYTEKYCKYYLLSRKDPPRETKSKRELNEQEQDGPIVGATITAEILDEIDDGNLSKKINHTVSKQDDWTFIDTLHHITIKDKTRLSKQAPGGDMYISLKGALITQLVLAVVGFIALHQILVATVAKANLITIQKKKPDGTDGKSGSYDITMFKKHDEETGDSTVSHLAKNKESPPPPKSSRMMIILYCSVLTCLLLSWFILTIYSVNVLQNRKSIVYKGPEQRKQNVTEFEFECKFEVNEKSHVTEKTVQCLYSAEQSSHMTKTCIHAVEYNVMVCGAISCLLFIHLFYTILLLPLMQQRHLAQLGEQVLLSEMITDLHLLSFVLTI